jgi:hypothetical protein
MKIVAELDVYGDDGHIIDGQVIKVEAHNQYSDLVVLLIDGKTYKVGGKDLKKAVEKVLY